jgi:hypothetical protein
MDRNFAKRFKAWLLLACLMLPGCWETGLIDVGLLVGKKIAVPVLKTGNLNYKRQLKEEKIQRRRNAEDGEIRTIKSEFVCMVAFDENGQWAEGGARVNRYVKEAKKRRLTNSICANLVPEFTSED